jgi:serine/threonine protein kinase
MVGTPAYISPEVLLGRGHGKGCDYWATGVLLYEMLDGSAPFSWEGATQRDEFELILNCDYKCPESFPEEAKDLIQKLLVLEPEKRLGNKPRGNMEIMAHDWFNSINFKRLRKKEIGAPWAPDVKDAFNASNFGTFNSDQVKEPYRELTKKEQEEFSGF